MLLKHYLKFYAILCLFFTANFCSSCSKNNDFTESATLKNDFTTSALPAPNRKPNIIMILVDDIGYEVPGYTGGQSYSTPNVNRLAQQGMQFTHCIATPNCCPSRVELLSGKYSFRNYSEWSIYNTAAPTFVSLLKGAGYATCVAGKWQFDGGDASAKAMGFDKYLLHYPFLLPDGNDDYHRYKNPVLYSNGAYLPSSQTQGKYADDMFVDYISKFIDSNKKKPFFVYYPLSLCHFPFQPTPDDPEYAAFDPETHKTNPRFFPSMVKYMDKKVGEVVSKIESSGLANNTYIIFSSDNGSPESILSQFNGRTIQGGKNHSNDFGVHVPLVVYCPGKIAPGTVQRNIVDYSDFFKTITDLGKVGTAKVAGAGILDSKSFAPYINSSTPVTPRTWAYCYWKPDPLRAPVQNKHFVQDLNYKLYDSTNSNRFYNILVDSLEKVPLRNAQLTPQEKAIKDNFTTIISQMHN